MKSKRNSSEAITKGYLKKELSRLATKDELKKQLTKLATKEELRSLERKFDFKLEGFKEEIDENAKKYRDDILMKLDGVMGELQTRSEE